MLWYFVIAAVAIFLYKIATFGARPKDYPPGPPTKPILGNLLDFPKKDPHVGLQQLSAQYGPVMGLKLAAMDVVVLNSYTAVKDLFDKRSSIYSNRTNIYVREYGNTLNMTFRDYDDVWRRQRKRFHTLLTSTAASRYLAYQQFESKELLCDLVKDPYDSQHATMRYATSLGSTINYGFRVNDPDNYFVRNLFQWLSAFSVLVITSQITEFFAFLRPILRRIPPSWSKLNTTINTLADREKKLCLELLGETKGRLNQGKMAPCFAAAMLTNPDKDGHDELEIAYNALHSWAASSDTTFNTLRAFFKAAILYPDFQKLGQQELDRVIGDGRLPEWKDRNQLPYVRSIVKESLRWLPPAVFGTPHSNSKDDEYMGYRIPKGTSIIPNIWSINNDPVRYPEPRKFDPSRYIDDPLLSAESAAQGDPARRDHFTFGSGRRICPGMHVADRSLFLVIARILWAFNIEGVDNEIIDPDAMKPGITGGSLPFKSKCVPRDDKRVQLITDLWAEAETWLDSERNYSDAWYEKEFSTK